MKTILVVDDERNIVELVRLYLEKEGFNVVAASDGEQALAQYERCDPDLVVLDLMLPKMDGFEVCREAAIGDRRLDLRAREFDLLAALARDPGVVLTRDALLEDVWGTDFPGETRTVDVHVAEVRKKLGDDGPQVETIRGIGYRLVPPPRGAAPSTPPPDAE